MAHSVRSNFMVAAKDTYNLPLFTKYGRNANNERPSGTAKLTHFYPSAQESWHIKILAIDNRWLVFFKSAPRDGVELENLLLGLYLLWGCFRSCLIWRGNLFFGRAVPCRAL